jgi:hypothetical protein
MNKLIQYAQEADFMTINLEIDGKKYSFSLDKELRIVETKLNQELKDQARSYAFLAMLRNKVKQQVKHSQRELTNLENALFFKYKEKTDKVTEATKQSKSDPKYLKKQTNLDRLQEIQDVLDIAVTAFLQRKDLLQTLSSNIRTENK